MSRTKDILNSMSERPSRSDEVFLWFANDGQDWEPKEMTTLHLFHTVRMLWNHTVPDRQRFKPYPERNLTLDAEDREEAMCEMLAELGRRVDKTTLTPAQQGELVTIRLKDKVWTKALDTLARDEQGRSARSSLASLTSWTTGSTALVTPVVRFAKQRVKALVAAERAWQKQHAAIDRETQRGPWED